METYCVRQNRLILVSNCTIYNRKKSRFTKSQEVSGLLGKLGIRTLLSNIPLIGDTFF